MQFEDILYENRNGVAWITINRPEKMNAFRGTTCDELIKALNKAGYDRDVGCIVLAGAGDRAFCTGGDQSAHDGNYDGRGTIGLPMEELHTAIRDVPKPVIARVQGYAIGGGNVLATLCDFTIASEKAQFGQVGPKVGSVDPGFGTAYLARVVGEFSLPLHDRRADEDDEFLLDHAPAPIAEEVPEPGLLHPREARPVVVHVDLHQATDRDDVATWIRNYEPNAS
jgi:enoyl-CoA hydratase/carnithine racemase